MLHVFWTKNVMNSIIIIYYCTLQKIIRKKMVISSFSNQRVLLGYKF